MIPLKLLIITAPLGNGHNSVAGAVASAFSVVCPEAECKILDMYAYVSPSLQKMIAKGYFLSMKTLSRVHDMVSDIYDRGDERDYNEYTPSRLANEILASRLRDAIDEERPDAIVCTMVYAAQVVDLLKARGVVTCPCFGIITDFTVQNYWEDCDSFEYIVSPSEYLKPQFDRRSIDLSRVLPYGIPIRQSFLTPHDKAEMRRKFDLEQDTSTVLIMSGGMGFGNICKYVKEIDAMSIELQMAVVCGSNEKLFEDISGLSMRKRTKVFGFIDNIDELMDAADCLLTKPGGITTSESLAKGLPMLMIDPLPGVEDRNVEFLQANGAAMFITKTFQIPDALYLLFQCPGRLDRIHAAIDSIAKPHAAEDICKKILETLEEQP